MQINQLYEIIIDETDEFTETVVLNRDQLVKLYSRITELLLEQTKITQIKPGTINPTNPFTPQPSQPTWVIPSNPWFTKP